MVPIHAHDFGLHPLWIAFVPLLDLREFGLKTTHLHAGPHCFLVEWPEKQTNGNPKNDEHPAVAEIQSRTHPQQDPHHDRRERLHDSLEESAVRVRVFESATESQQAPPFLWACVELEPERSIG